MGDLVINCPVCCKKTFNSKETLVEHLSEVLSKLVCPICDFKLASLAHLIEHLTVDSCQQPSNITHTVVFSEEITSDSYIQPHQNSSEKLEQHQNDNLLNEENHSVKDKIDDDVDINKMYVEILNKQFMKPCLQTQEVKLMNGESRYVILSPDSDDLNSDNTIVTKQNNDGTISLTTIKDMKVESDTLITQMENEPEDNHDELYSCNTCGVSFSSVIDHIQNYHNDQEVVVEEPIEDDGTDSNIMEYDQVQEQPAPLEQSHPPRRVITDSGDIIEAPVVPKTETVNKLPLPMKEEVTDKHGRVYTRKYVQIDKLSSNINNEHDTSDEKKTIRKNHRVVIKEVQTPSGEKVEVYNCMVCNIYVSTLDDFKSEPCRKLSVKYSCVHCPVAYDNSKSLCAHMKAHKAKSGTVIDDPVSFECEVCSTTFHTNKSLKLHKRMHDPIKSRLPEQDTDGEMTNDKFLCLVCDKMIPTSYRSVHEESHDYTDKINCDICNKKFNSKEYLDMHMKVHNLDKVVVKNSGKTLPYTCLYCNRQFARPHEKVKHERIHTGEKPHSCEICGKSFRVAYCLTLHMRTHTGARPYACPHCGKRFKAHSVYNHHLLTHSEVRAYKCPYCPKAFKTSVQLAGHKNSHTKPFSCKQCNRPFASLYAVRVHTETHSRQNNLKFSCSLCGASYARAFALKDHIKDVHKQKNADTTSFREEDYIREIRENTDAADALIKDSSTGVKIEVKGMNVNELIIP